MALKKKAASKRPGNPPQGRRDYIVVAGVLLSFLLPLFTVLVPGLLEHTNNKLYDLFLLQSASAPSSQRIAIVDIDEPSLREHGQWPWPRYKMAAIIDRLRYAGAAVVVFDMVFPERDRTSLAVIHENLTHDLGLDIILEKDVLPDNDQVFAQAIEKSAVVLGYQFLFDRTGPPEPSGCRLHPLTIHQSSDQSQWEDFVWTARQSTCNLAMFSRATDRSGFFNVSPDPDGFLRHVPLLIRYQEQYYPSLALAAVMKALGADSLTMSNDLFQKRLHLGPQAIPIDLTGSMLVNYRRRDAPFPFFSATDLLAGKVSRTQLKDKIVFVGTSAVGLRDFRSIPGNPIFPAIAVHATVADNILTGDFCFRPYLATGMEVLGAVACGILFVLVHARSRASFGVALIIGCAAGLLGLSYWLFIDRGLFFSPILPLAVLVVNFTTVNLLRFWREENRARRSIRNLSRAQSAIIESMASMTETRDSDTGGHIQRTQEYVRLLAKELGRDPQYSAMLTDKQVDLLYRSAPLHDIGKVGITDNILLKRGRLSPEEFEEMKRHTIIGRNIIAATNHKLGDGSFLKIAHEIAYTHHEKWDGSGYPQGLKGNQIPLSGRLMALADAYDALTSRRVYKPAFSHEEAVAEITRQSGISFDPNIVAVFKRLTDEFKKVAITYTDRV